jgi:hypothetical protein
MPDRRRTVGHSTIKRALIAGSLVLSASVLSAQATVLVDSGTLLLSGPTWQGGTEAFMIVRRATPDRGYVLTSTRTGGGRVMHSTLTTDSLGVPIAYAHDGRGGEAGEQQMTVRRVGDQLIVEDVHLLGRGRSYLGSTSGTYQMPPGALLLDRATVHQLYLIGLREVPRVLKYLSFFGRGFIERPVTMLGPDDVVIRGDTIPATRLMLGASPGGQEIWIDSQKRILKVHTPGQQGMTAIRDRRPR